VSDAARDPKAIGRQTIKHGAPPRIRIQKLAVSRLLSGLQTHPLLSSTLVCSRLLPVGKGNCVRSLSVRCEQGAKGGGGGGGLDVWLSRGAMLGFVGAVTVELTTGKCVLQVWVVFLACF